MKDGFIKVGADTINIKVANCDYNAQEIIKSIITADSMGVKFLVLPELCVTGYTCGDLFLQTTLLKDTQKSVRQIQDATKNTEVVALIGAPLLHNCKLYNCAIVIQKGQILGVVPKTYLPTYTEFYEDRYFTCGKVIDEMIEIDGTIAPFGTDLIFHCQNYPQFTFGVEICEDFWVPNPPATELARAGANIIANLSASDETVGKAEYRRLLATSIAGRCNVGYIYASCGDGESTQDLVFGGHNMICEGSKMLAESKLFDNRQITTELDLGKLTFEKRRISSFRMSEEKFRRITFTTSICETVLTRTFNKYPFIPSTPAKREDRCPLVLTMQAKGLQKRMQHTEIKKLVLGLSGGLDSALALLVCINTLDLLGLPHSNLIALGLPSLSSSQRTQSNAKALALAVGATYREIDISKSLAQHLSDISHDQQTYDTTYENAQARERTQILMDIANMEGGLVVGTGDMSEAALGWETYNGDHMSMYGVNSSVPKTLVKFLVSYYVEKCNDEKLVAVL
ncbi:MAG: NAD(+) synthase, partial [Clostridia bacterium]